MWQFTIVFPLKEVADLTDHLYLFGGTILGYGLVFFLLFRRVVRTLFHPFSLNLALLTLSLSVSAYCFIYDNETSWTILAYLHLYLLAFVVTFFTLYSRSSNGGPNNMARVRNSFFLDLCLYLVSGIVAAQLFVIFSGADFSLLHGAAEDKAQVGQRWHFVFRIFVPCIFFVGGFFWVYDRGDQRRRIAFLAFFGSVLAMALQGSKTAALNVILFVALGLVVGGEPTRPKVLLSAKSLTAAIIGALALLGIIVLSSENSLEVLAYQFLARPFLQFDQLITVAMLDCAHLGNEYSESIAQWYLAPVLKPLGMYASQFDDVSHFYQTVVLGYAIDVAKPRANDNFILEVMWGAPSSVRAFLVLACGALEGGTLGFFWRTRYRSGFHYLCWVNRVWTPFMILIYGSGSFAYWTVFLGIMLASAVLRELWPSPERRSDEAV